ncbi:MAG: FecR domain-containing protein [Calditrichae bacterium]|nr:FecR domain-containing protein [Calditrichia bacterium]
MNNSEIKLIENYISGPRTAELEKEFNDWLKQSAENKEKYRQYRKLLENIKPIEPPEIPDASIVWKRLQNSALKNETTPANVYSLDHIPISNRLAKYSWLAAAIILVVSGLFIWQMIIEDVITVKTVFAEQQNIILPDKSSVRLNAESEIHYAADFKGDVRKVILKGEAYFSVTKSTKPFVIQTGNAEITVLGTAFDVFSRYDRTEVIVTEGKVRLSPNREDYKPLNLTANQKGIINDKGVPDSLQNVDAEYMIGWLDNRFVFHKTPLSEAIDELQRRFDAQIIVTDPEIKIMTMSGSYAANDVDATLQSFCLALNLKLSRNNNSYIISK